MKLPIANYITLSRIIGALCLLPLEVLTQLISPFWLLYAFCGMTDIADGYVAHRLKTETKLGALLDSYADIIFIVCCVFKLIPLLILPSWLWIWIGLIIVIKVANQISALVIYHKLIFPHTLANKLTGLFLFISIPVFIYFGHIAILLFVAGLATFAAIQEGYVIIFNNHHK